MKLCAILLIALLVFPDTAGCYAEVCYGHPLGRGSCFGVSGEAPDQHDFVEIHVVEIRLGVTFASYREVPTICNLWFAIAVLFDFFG